jgi:hypothetical protein
MNRGVCAGRLPSSPRRRLGWAGAVLLALFGCAHQAKQARLQSEDDPDKYEVKTVRDWVMFDNTEPIAVAGVSLVTGLADTGGEAPPGDHRTMLENQLKKKGYAANDVKAILARKDASLVVVSGLIPAGAHKDDPIDLEVSLPPGSRTTSLRGGYLEPGQLFDYAVAEQLAPTFARGNGNFVPGHALVEAKGRLLVGLGDGEEAEREKHGRVWGGGRCKIDRPFRLVLNDGKRYARNSKLVADRINQSFRGQFGDGLAHDTAVARDDHYIDLNVPPQYRLNLPRYMRVVGLIPLRDAEEAASVSAVEAARAYRRRLEEEALDPARTVTAALRLEALGESSRALLQRGLASEHTLVRFCCAESLAYLGDGSSARELARVVAEQPGLRAFALTALASLDEAASQDALLDLLSSPAAETRYGAFRALRALNEREPAVRGELLNDSFWLHRVAPDTPGLVHLCSSRRAEVVLFGEDAFLNPPFTLQADGFNVTAGDGDPQCTLACYAPHQPPQHRQCSLKVEDVLRTLADMGATYAEVVEVLRQARGCQCVTCAVEADALPQATSVYALKKAGERARAHADGAAADGSDDEDEILNARLELGSTPTLFEGGDGRTRASASGPRPRKEKDEKKTAQRRANNDED